MNPATEASRLNGAQDGAGATDFNNVINTLTTSLKLRKHSLTLVALIQDGMKTNDPDEQSVVEAGLEAGGP